MFCPTFINCYPSFLIARPMSRSNSNNTNVFCVQQTQASSIVIPGISDIVASYKCLLLDQFGVIHDGQRVYPGALEALQKAHELGIKSVIISNSSRRASTTLRKLKSLDINLDFISDVVTSGELAFKALPEFTSNHPNARVLHFNWGSSSRSAVSIFEHGFKNVAPCTREFLGVSVPDPKDVDVIVAHGTTGISCPDGTVKDIGWDLATELLKQVVETRPDVPFFVANPDIVTVDGPNLRTMPGALAKVFEENGGRTVHRLGKPDPVAYEEALRLAGVNRKDVLAVGDSMGHDVLGAADAGIQSLYIAGGINAERFKIDPEQGFNNIKTEWTTWNEDTLNQIIAEEAPSLGNRWPTYASSFFRW